MSAQSDPTGVRFGLPSRWTPPDRSDVIFVGVLLVAVLLAMGLTGASRALGFSIAASQVLPLVFRRQAPLLVAGVIAVACLGQLAVDWSPTPANVAVLIAIFSAAAYGTRAESFTVLGLGLLGAGLGALRWGSANAMTFLVIGFLLAMFVVLAWLVGDVTRRRNTVQARLADQDRALARDSEQRLKLAAQGERASIAREMHDVVAHSLAVVVVQADGALYAARTALEAPPSPADREALTVAANTLETLAETARSSLAETRRMVGVLREDGATAEYAPLEGLAELDRLVAGVRDSGRDVRVAVRGRIDDLPREVDLAAYRVIQEALTNVLKHAGPSAAVDVDVLRTPGVLLVRVTDDGSGREPGGDGAGHGIVGMTERIEVLGGSLHAGPRPRGGWEVVATVPVESSYGTGSSA